MLNLMFVLPVTFLLLSCLAFATLNVVVYQEKLSRRLDRVTGTNVKPIEAAAAESWHLRVVAAIGFGVARSGILSAKTLQQLRHTLRIAGVRSARSLGMFVGVKLLLMIGLPILGAVIGMPLVSSKPLLILIIGGMAVIGLLAPDFLINQRRKSFIKQLELGLADTLDMMVICADSGLSLEAALARVAHEIRGTHKAVSDELTLTTQEMRIGADVRDALTGLGARTGLGSLKRLGSTLIQTIQYGTPLTQALRILSAELRQEQLTRFEERAARLPVLLTVPMIVFILPCVFLVVGGPAVLKVMSAFANH
jgi:tight adherence protein C